MYIFQGQIYVVISQVYSSSRVVKGSILQYLEISGPKIPGLSSMTARSSRSQGLGLPKNVPKR